MGTGPRGRANHSVYTLDGLMTPIARHNEIDNRMARIIYKDARPSWGRLVEVSVYDVTVERGDRYWLVHVPAIGRTTQVRSLREVEPMARDLITVMSSESLDPDDLQLNVHVELPDEVQAHLQRYRVLLEESVQAQANAAAEWRSAARSLAGRGMTYRDIGAALGVSHQRAEQLVKTG